MKKLLISVICLSLITTSCSTTESGAVNGASLGSVFGSALGGLLGGYRGHNIGTMVGMVAGGATGAILGSQQEAKREGRRVNERRTRSVDDEPRQVYERNEQQREYDNEPSATSPLQLRNLRFVGQDGNDAINRNEICKVVFELANLSGHIVYNVVPSIFEVSGNEHIEVSPSTNIESIAHGDAIRYTATMRADSRLKAGTATFRIAVSTDGSEFLRLRDFSIATAK